MSRLFFIAFALFMLCTSHAKAYEMTPQEQSCMTSALYHEARGESDRGMFAVAAVIMNRTMEESFPDDVCGVVTQKGQFTYDHRAKMKEWDAVTKVKSIVAAIQEGFEPVHPFVYFHSIHVPGQCSFKKNRIRIGNHYFCS